jgi:hypothetical protein
LLEEMFGAAEAAAAGNRESTVSPGAPAKKEKVNLIEGKRAQNLNILLSSKLKVCSAGPTGDDDLCLRFRCRSSSAPFWR